MTPPSRRVLMIALDSLEPSMFTRLLAGGSLPNLSAFVARTTSLEVKSGGDLLHGTIWPTFASGLSAGDHGVYYWTQWLADEQRQVRNDHPAFSYAPFWSGFPDAGLRAVVVDVPYVPIVHGPGMRSLQCWGLHDEMVAGSSPASFRSEITRRFGKHPLSFDTLEPQSPKDKLEMMRALARGVRMRSRMIQAVAAEGNWDFFITTFGELHKAGHYLAAPQQLDSSTSNVDAITAILQPLDDAWPAIEAAAGSQTDLMLFGLHGMTHQVEFSSFGPQLIKIVLGEEPSDDAARPDLVRQVRDLIPDSVHRAIWRRLPPGFRAARQAQLSASSLDTRTSALFPLTHDGPAAVRVNLARRERDGFVTTAQRSELLDKLDHATAEFLADDGQRAFIRLWRQEEMPGVRSHRLPDALMVPNPAVTQTHQLRGLSGRVLLSSREEARNGVHTSHGFCYVQAAGSPDVRIGSVDVRDFAPTVLSRLGLEVPTAMAGATFFG
jgi:predicted AlkP superfamily phosphohydrolase/phosphomutase